MPSALAIVSYFLGIVLILYGLLPFFGIGIPLGSTAQLILLLACGLWLAIDGFNEDHIFKYTTLAFAFFFVLLIAIPFLNSAGYIPFGIPMQIIGYSSYINIAGGVLLFVGPFVYD